MRTARIFDARILFAFHHFGQGLVTACLGPYSAAVALRNSAGHGQTIYFTHRYNARVATQEREVIGAAAKATPVEEFRSHRARFLILALLSALLLFPSLHRRGLAGYDDAVYAHEGKEMVRTGDWWNIRFNGNLNFEYPPLFLWLEAGSFKLFGVNDAAAKFPSALLGFGTIVLVYFLTLELTGQRWLSLLAMLVLTSTQFFLKNAAHAMTDVPFTFFSHW